LTDKEWDGGGEEKIGRGRIEQKRQAAKFRNFKRHLGCRGTVWVKGKKEDRDGLTRHGFGGKESLEDGEFPT